MSGVIHIKNCQRSKREKQIIEGESEVKNRDRAKQENSSREEVVAVQEGFHLGSPSGQGQGKRALKNHCCM